MATDTTLLDLVLHHWWQIGLTCCACSVSIVLAHWLGITKPFPLSIILAGIQTFMIVEVVPFLFPQDDGFTPVLIIGVWVLLAGVTFFIPDIQKQSGQKKSDQTVWQHFEEVDSASNQGSTKGEETWVEYSQ